MKGQFVAENSARARRSRFIPTRDSLLSRLRSDSEGNGWTEFYEMYGNFIVNAALDCGLSEADAEDVLQETVIEVTKRIHEFRYDPKRCRFKTWLMRITRSKVVDRIRREDPAEPLDDEAENQFETNFAVEWEEDWRSNIAAEALRLVRQRSRPKVFQMFQLSTVEGRDPVAVARFLGVTRLAVYMARYKVLREIRREVQKLEKGDF